MKSFEKLLNVLAKNLGYTVVLAAAIILFAIFSDGIIPGAITALSAAVGYACVVALAREYKKCDAPKKAPAAKKAPAKKPAKK